MISLFLFIIWSRGLQPLSPEQLVHPESPPIPGESQGKGDQAVYVACDSPSLLVVTMSGGWH